MQRKHIFNEICDNTTLNDLRCNSNYFSVYVCSDTSGFALDCNQYYRIPQDSPNDVAPQTLPGPPNLTLGTYYEILGQKYWWHFLDSMNNIMNALLSRSWLFIPIISVIRGWAFDLNLSPLTENYHMFSLLSRQSVLRWRSLMISTSVQLMLQYNEYV